MDSAKKNIKKMGVQVVLQKKWVSKLSYYEVEFPAVFAKVDQADQVRSGWK